MAEEILNDSLPDLKELENKIGRKTPESLLIWMKDAADCEDEVADRGDQRSADSFSDKINNLKQEMRWLRSADVRILRQLVALHEGIEAMRWLMEERGTLASRGSSLTGSLSSLATVEEHWPSMSPCRESPSPTCLQELTETSSIESADQQPPSHTDFVWFVPMDRSQKRCTRTQQRYSTLKVVQTPSEELCRDPPKENPKWMLLPLPSLNGQKRQFTKLRRISHSLTRRQRKRVQPVKRKLCWVMMPSGAGWSRRTM
ncbi:leucine rich adaptor protein 1-like isoform X2 [Amphiprion ocellaris]|uniref:Leucine rich adaptor protein 1 n=1 Tax=Amphiprion ocellaris TaxID=80972 RepID=A0AAQ5X8X8_AMPOC|nr:leucine rich adaptor protein 1-like isoform X2 [Amphiprion ocellaris]